MKKLTYTEIQGIFERLFFSPIIGIQPIRKEYKVIFSKLSEERVLALHNLAQSCKRLEISYNKSANKFHWWLEHATQYKNYRSSVIQIISYYYPNINKDFLETTRKSLQERHSNALKEHNLKKPFRWMCANEVIEIHGLKLTKGLFYIGDYFKIPQSYKNIKAFNPRHREYWEYNRNYKLSKLYGTVIHDDLPISKDKLNIVPFSSYLDMHPTHRYEYLEWLTGHKRISEISSETFLFYLLGLQLRMFIDDTATEKERLEIINSSIDLYIQCREENVCYIELVNFIDAALSKFCINRLEELVPKDLLPYLALCREALILTPYNSDKNGSIMENICRNIMCILNFNDSIPKQLLTDSFYVQFADMVESELLKMSYKNNWEELQKVITNPESFNHFELYCINSPQDYSLLLYDYIFSFQLFPNIYSLGFFNQCINNCFKRIVNRIGEYNILVSELPSEASSSIFLFDTDSQNIHAKIHRIITEGEDFATVEKETDATEYAINEIATANRHQISLSEEKLAKVEKQTELAQELLSYIFEDEDNSSKSAVHENKDFLNVLKILLSKESWKRDEVENLCKEHHLMTGSVLEQINDYSYTKIEDAVIEDNGDIIYVITEYKDKLI
jgi:hypothetical protein